ncbi:MAG TPA: phosphoribosylformylglycinamidine synthase I [Lentisphaeria bacterium]|nr:MAG: phosphoribosylformylglycinamidine synthase I [Lentisphaerae bacterium GWF2_50_93]HCE43179.1 phosphoribosylformylglycinamidine synthase I [Lentisphaeria bacterium]
MKKNISKKARALVITGFGLNCEAETSAAFRICGAVPEQLHLNDLLSGKRRMDEFHILAFIGGFSFGDHLGAGTIFANRIKFRIREQLEKFVSDGKLVIGICNGFQTISRLGLVPALDGKYFFQQAALAHNDSGTFRDDWVHLKGNPKCKCIFTKGIDKIFLPVRHGEGKFVADDNVLKRIEKENLVALRYCDEKGNIKCKFPQNPNGSLNSIAGICDATGRIFGLMPHPEAYLSPFNSPYWTTEKIKGKLPREGQGVVIFRNAVEFASENLV